MGVRVRCRVLGPIEVHTGDGWTRLRGQQAMLLAHLVAAHPRPVGFRRLEQAFWGDDPPSQPDNAMKVAVARLRKTFGTDLVEHSPTGYALRVDDEAIDLKVFERSVDQARALAEAGDSGPALEQLQNALDGITGAPFATVGHDIGLQPMIHAVGETCAAAEDLRIDLLLAIGHTDRAAAEASRATTAAPLRERRWEQLMLALHAGGRAVEALRVFQQYRDLLDAEMGLAPGSSILELESAIIGDRSTARWQRFGQVVDVARSAVDIADPARELTPFVGTRPVATTPFLGRIEELDALSKAVASHQFVTVVGPPGVGKTRLVLAWTAGLPEGGAAWLDLAVETPDTVDEALRGAFGSQGARLAWADLVVLDNAEHVADQVAATIERLLAASWPGTAVVTSRTGLNSPHERLVRVGPMPMHQATRLLRTHLPSGLWLDDRDTERVVQATDGLPLAIELAARRLDGELVDELVASIGLAEANADIVRLDPPDRSFFVSLGVLTGSFEASVAARLAGCSTQAAEAALHRLTAASIIQRAPSMSASGAGRFRLLEPLRQAAAAMAAEQGRLDELRRRHIEHYAAHAVERSRGLLTHDEERTVDQLELDAPQIRSAWHHACATGDADRASMLASAWWWMTLRSLSHRDYERPFATLSVTGFGNSGWRVEALAAAAMSEWARGRLRSSIECGERALAAAGILGVATPLEARLGLVASYGMRNRTDDAQRQLFSTISEARTRESWYHLSAAQAQVAIAFSAVGLLAEAGDQAAGAIESAERSDNTSTLAFARHALAITLTDEDPQRALSEAHESIRLATRVRNRWVAGWTTATIASLYRRLGRTEEAAIKLDGLLGHWHSLGMEPQLVQSALQSALLFDTVGDSAGAGLALTLANEGRTHHPMAAGDLGAVRRIRRRLPTPTPDRPERELVAALRERLAILHGSST